jgi:nucleoside-diphosphate-sugar epimerase
MIILISGASGLVGNFLCRWFIASGHTVIGICHRSSSEINHPLFREVRADLRNSEISITVKLDLIIHCAATIPSISHEMEVEEEYSSNISIDNTILNLWGKVKCKLIYFSSAYVYDQNVL